MDLIVLNGFNKGKKLKKQKSNHLNLHMINKSFSNT